MRRTTGYRCRVSTGVGFRSRVKGALSGRLYAFRTRLAPARKYPIRTHLRRRGPWTSASLRFIAARELRLTAGRF